MNLPPVDPNEPPPDPPGQLIPVGYRDTGITTLVAKAEYHMVMPVRRHDLVHVKEDLERIKSPRRWIFGIASVLAGVSAAALIAGITALYSKPLPSFDLRFSYFATFIASGAIAVVLFIVDSKTATGAVTDTGHVVERLDELIGMFDDPTKAM